MTRLLFVSGVIVCWIGCADESPTMMEDGTAISVQSEELQTDSNFANCRPPEQCLPQCGLDFQSTELTKCGPNSFCCIPPSPPEPPPPTPPSPPPSIFKSSVGVGLVDSQQVLARQPIRDLKFEKGDSSNQTPLDGYHLISADLNRRASGRYIYLTFTRDASKVINDDQCDLTTSPYITGLRAASYNFIDAAFMKGSCFSPWTPIWEPVWLFDDVFDWKHIDLNDGSGGRFIYAWQSKVDGEDPILEVGVVSGNQSNIRCPSGWVTHGQDLNEGAGGDYIYFCYKK